MTTPNLDALAKLGPFGFDNITQLRASDVFDALNEWVELRAYRERTEAVKSALRENADWSQLEWLCANGMFNDEIAQGEPSPPPPPNPNEPTKYQAAKARKLREQGFKCNQWGDIVRDPAPKGAP